MIRLSALPKLFAEVATFSAAPASDFGTMRRVLQLRAVALLVVVCGSALAAQASAFAQPVHERPAGCHSHKIPAREPANYSCCIAGHDVVSLPPSFLVQPCVRVVGAVLLPALASETTPVRRFEDLQGSCSDPPGDHPLRI